jgi:HD-GYP domain-containing protein (c-di-GMP phosphodiesterase class II)
MTTLVHPSENLSYIREGQPSAAGGMKERLQEMMPLLESIFGLADPLLWPHSLRVGKMARETAEVLGLRGQGLEQAEIAGYLHDAGRAVHDKRADASPVEGIIRPTDNGAHALRAAKIVSSLPWLSPVMPAVLFHHECWDGSGVPAGLRGESIPLGARIIAVVDAFDRMVGGSEPGAEQPINHALNTIRNERGHLYDSDVVNAFIDACSLSLTSKHLRGRPHFDLRY